ncbi:sulfate adenylyltransferase [Candidatus Omnitrophota bacterium]
MNTPHGNKLVCRVLTKKNSDKIIMDKSNPWLVVDFDTLLDLENICVGAYSPLEGFMTKETLGSVLSRKRLLNDLAWTMPILLTKNSQKVRNLSKNSTIVLCSNKNIPIGTMKIKDIYLLDKQRIAKNIFGTTNKNHPGVQKLYLKGDVSIGGETWLIQKNLYPFHSFNLEPKDVRKIIQQKEWKTIAGFQTRNVPHRAHEFLQKTALSMVDGIFIHPIIGWKKKGDFNPEIIIKTYKILTSNYYPKGRTILSGLSTAMRYAGPLEAIFHAIIRKNFGCTHFIVGRDHAGVNGFYEKYSAHRIFDKFPDLGIVPLLLRGPYYCRKCLNIVNDKICPHPNTNYHIEISGTIIRKMLSRRKNIPDEYLRKEISEFILRHKKEFCLRGNNDG